MSASGREDVEVGRRGDVTLAQVAAQAGVAVGTASKALSGAPHVRQSTRDRVLASAEMLGYTRNEAARALKTGRSYMVGLITSDAEGRFTLPVILGAENSLATGHMAILFCDAHDDPIRELHWIDTLLGRNVDGFIVTSHRSDPRKSISEFTDLPTVYAYSPSVDDSDVSVVPDDEQGGRIAGEHLLSVGRRSIVHVGGPQSYLASKLRRRGLMSALKEADLDTPTAPIHGPWTERAGRLAARVLLSRGARFDGVFCGSDQIARGVSEELQAHGIRVPEDVSIVGFDDWDMVTMATDPRLTSVSMNLGKVGGIAATRLLEIIGGVPVAPGIERVPCELVTRESSS